MALPNVGVKLVVEDATNFDKTLKSAEKAIESFGATASTTAASGMKAFGAAATVAMNGFGAATKLAGAAFSGLGGIIHSVIAPIETLFDRVFKQVIRTLTSQAVRAVENFIGSLVEAAVKGSELETNLTMLNNSLVEVSKASFKPLTTQLGDLVDKAAPAFLGIVQAAEQYLGGLGQSALTWGEGLVNSFAQGMWNAVGEILSVLTDIAGQIAYFLSPGSPPRILPDIDQWGTDAANEYFGGWRKADFGVFTELGSTIANLIRSMPLPKADQTGVIPSILGARQGIAAAVEELRSTGNITRATMDAITASVGTADTSVRGYLESMVRLQAANETVKAAQAELNKVTEEYKKLLAPVESQIAGIIEEQQQLADAQKRSLLELVLKDPNSSANAKRMAQLEIERLNVEKNRRALLAEQKVKVEAADKNLQSAKSAQQIAQDEFDARRALIQVQTEQNNLLREQLRLLESLEKQAAKEKEKTGGGPAKLGGFAIKPFKWEDLIPPEIWKKIDELKAAWDALWKEILVVMQPAVDAWNNSVVPAWNKLVKAFLDSIPEIKGRIADFIAFNIGEFAITLPAVFTLTGIALSTLANIWERHHSEMLSVTQFVFEAIVLAVNIGLTLMFAAIAITLNTISGLWDAFSALASGDITEMWRIIKETNDRNNAIMQYTFGVVLKQVLFFFGLDVQDLDKIWHDAWQSMIDFLNVSVKPNIENVLQGLAAAFAGPIGAVHALLDGIKELWNFLNEHVFNFPSLPGPFGSPGPNGGPMPPGGINGTVNAPASSAGAGSYSVSNSVSGGSVTYAPTYIGTAPPVSAGFATISALWGSV